MLAKAFTYHVPDLPPVLHRGGGEGVGRHRFPGHLKPSNCLEDGFELGNVQWLRWSITEL